MVSRDVMLFLKKLNFRNNISVSESTSIGKFALRLSAYDMNQHRSG